MKKNYDDLIIINLYRREWVELWPKSHQQKRGGETANAKNKVTFLHFLHSFFVFVFLLIVVTASVTRKRADIIYKYFLMFILLDSNPLIYLHLKFEFF